MSFDWWTLGLQTVNLLVLLWILSHFLFRPVSEIIAKRQAAATDELSHARAARAEAEAARDAAQARDAAVAARRAELLTGAQAEAESAKRQMLEEARKEVSKLRAEAQAEAQRRHAEAERALRDEAADLAVDIARRLLDRLPETTRSSGFIDGLAQAVAALPEQTREGLGAEGPVPVRAARELSDDETVLLKSRLAEVLGREIALAVTADPSLIAGIELDAPHAVVRNHFRADLDRIRQELLRHD
ncbi:F0F1 ATP synthase subunit delta [Alloyangia pacifica]|uniref:F0F1 ATP synthase subunit delta n=1 Tax=Alloyangia pacifica TaxID=311180 RepID=UPI001CFDFFF4|nr:F0F1 ATP synthase subunit delta [Alloyangia pacifica]